MAVPEATVGGIAFSPLAMTAEGSRGGLCDMLEKSTGKVGLMALSDLERYVILAKPYPDGSAAEMIDFGEALISVAFIDGSTLAGKD